MDANIFTDLVVVVVYSMCNRNRSILLHGISKFINESENWQKISAFNVNSIYHKILLKENGFNKTRKSNQKKYNSNNRFTITCI